EQPGKFWHLRYKLTDGSGYVELATTRPETMLGDTAVAVNPADDRYKDLVGKTVILPLVNKEIPIVADDYVDMEFGTGVVKITPAHDPNDFEVGQRHDLPIVNCMTDDAKITEDFPKYAGMDRFEARDAIVKDLEAEGALVKIEDHVHNVGTCYRCHTTIEPRVSLQWFVHMDELAKPAIEAVKNGETEFIPKHFDKTYFHWLENIKDWCISRQLWWGHRIPAFYCDDCGEMVVTKDDNPVCPKCGKPMRQDPDTLDTWFSSALWPFSVLGWPEETPELKYFYPTDVLVTGYDIILFWVIRMMFSGIEHTGQVPFKKVLIHGLVRDSQGRKMSKSLGNGIDPLEIIEEYGADALRFTLITGNAPGNDMRFYMERVEASRNFANKVWNASRFIQMNMPEDGIDLDKKPDNFTDADKWILSKANKVAKDVTENLDKYEIGIAADKIYNFIWEEFCDWYIEMVKPRLYNDDDETKYAALWTLQKVLIDSLKLLHPYMPFITEEIFCNLQDKEESIMISDWPEFSDEYDFAEEEEAVETIKETVRAIRNVRSEMNVPPSKKATVFVVSEDANIRDIFKKGEVFFATLGYASEVIIQEDKTGIDDSAVSVVIPNANIYIPFAELVDIDKEIERLEKEVERLDKELARVNGMLSNENFVSKAPEAKINEEKEKKAKYEQMKEQVETQLKNFKK
ncbi:MAG: valine--tRNA ligase, partial [Eubacterium sp.]|nr:valine--tRNA ligase [Eubacterium sp.]